MTEENIYTGEDLPEFDEMEAFYSSIDFGEYGVIPIAYKKDKFALTYYPPHFEEGSFISDYYGLKLGNYHLCLHRTFIKFWSEKTRGIVRFDIKMKLKDFVDIKMSPFDLELDQDVERGKNFDNLLADEDIILDIDLEKIDKKLQRIEALRLFL